MVPISINFFESEGRPEKLCAGTWRNTCPSIKPSPSLSCSCSLLLFPSPSFFSPPFSSPPFPSPLLSSLLFSFLLSLSRYKSQKRYFMGYEREGSKLREKLGRKGLKTTLEGGKNKRKVGEKG